MPNSILQGFNKFKVLQNYRLRVKTLNKLIISWYIRKRNVDKRYCIIRKEFGRGGIKIIN